jgi:hypothetical protein
MEALTGKRFIDDPASAIVINSKPITSVQTVKEMATTSELILNLQALDTSEISHPGRLPEIAVHHRAVTRQTTLRSSSVASIHLLEERLTDPHHGTQDRHRPRESAR